MVLFFAVAGSQWLASASSLNSKQWKWFLGDHLEPGPANQSTHEELSAENKEPRQRLKSSLMKKISTLTAGTFKAIK